MSRTDVMAAAHRRATFLIEGDADGLREILHPEFAWTAHTGDVFARDEYIRRNTDGTVRWLDQTLREPEVTVVSDAAVLRCVVTDRVVRDGAEISVRMPVTQAWVRSDSRWLCLAGHAGPLLD